MHSLVSGGNSEYPAMPLDFHEAKPEHSHHNNIRLDGVSTVSRGSPVMGIFLQDMSEKIRQF